jgi:hypothetical protein
LVVYRYLSRSRPETRLVVGFRDGEGAIEGHAWVAIGDRAMAANADERGAFAPAVSFGRDGRIVDRAARVD